jgi:hypothetical protein
MEQTESGLAFVPWGWMPSSMQIRVGMEPPFTRFRAANGWPGNTDEWQKWLEDVANAMKEFLWPRWDTQSRTWDGDVRAAKELTVADLELMQVLRPRLDAPIGAGGTAHRRLFLEEDKGPPTWKGLLEYLPAASGNLQQQFDGLLIEGGMQLAEPAILQLKMRMQRPRPYQTSFLLGTDVFPYDVAVTAVTPSLVSGNCLQGMMALANVVVRSEFRTGEPLSSEVLLALQRFFVDGGDRRVYAGVHYPSDNLSSWFAALRLCRRLAFDNPDDQELRRKQRQRAREVLWAGIQQSPVFNAMETSEAHSIAMRALEEEAQQNVDLDGSDQPILGFSQEVREAQAVSTHPS